MRRQAAHVVGLPSPACPRKMPSLMSGSGAGTFVMPRHDQVKTVALTLDVAESYAPLYIAFTYAGQRPSPKPDRAIVSLWHPNPRSSVGSRYGGHGPRSLALYADSRRSTPVVQIAGAVLRATTSLFIV
jgi:hypothetical protein